MTSRSMYDAQTLVAHLRSQGYGDDEALLIDSIEGETNALAAVDRIVSEIGEAEQNQAVLKLREEEFAGRRQRYAARAEGLRASLLAWLTDTGLKTLERPEATLSVTAGRVGVNYTADFGVETLPEQFVKTSREPDKAAVRKAVLAGETIIGAEISNAPPILTIRRS